MITDKAISEGNELIAKFLGAIYTQFSLWHFFNIEELPFLNGRNGIESEELYFDTDWNWLMCVVEKIERSNFAEYQFNFNITGDGICISKFDDGSGVISSVHNDWGKSKLSSTWTCVVEFIKWYNNEKIKIKTNGKRRKRNFKMEAGSI